MEISEEYLANIIDHTLLKPNATTLDLEKLCKEAIEYNLGAVCVRPCDVSDVYSMLKGTDVKVCTVVGFPWGIQTIENKVLEACEAVCNGAREIDMVINRKYLKENYSLLNREIRDLVNNVKTFYSKDVIIKTILETCELTDKEIIAACLSAREGGTDYVKTSTGLYEGATVKAVKLMHKTVPELGVKASGGINTWNKAKKMIEAGATRIGTSSGGKIVKEYRKAYGIN